MLWPRPSFPPAAQAAVRRTPAQASTSSFHGGPGRGGPIFRLHARRPRADLVVVASSSSSASSSFAYVPLAAYPCHHLAHSIRRKRRPTDEDKEEPSRHPDAPPEVSDGGRQALDSFLDRRILQLAQLEFPPDSVSSPPPTLRSRTMNLEPELDLPLPRPPLKPPSSPPSSLPASTTAPEARPRTDLSVQAFFPKPTPAPASTSLTSASIIVKKPLPTHASTPSPSFAIRSASPPSNPLSRFPHPSTSSTSSTPQPSQPLYASPSTSSPVAPTSKRRPLKVSAIEWTILRPVTSLPSFSRAQTKLRPVEHKVASPRPPRSTRASSPPPSLLLEASTSPSPSASSSTPVPVPFKGRVLPAGTSSPLAVLPASAALAAIDLNSSSSPPHSSVPEGIAMVPLVSATRKTKKNTQGGAAAGLASSSSVKARPLLRESPRPKTIATYEILNLPRSATHKTLRAHLAAALSSPTFTSSSSAASPETLLAAPNLLFIMKRRAGARLAIAHVRTEAVRACLRILEGTERDGGVLRVVLVDGGEAKTKESRASASRPVAEKGRVAWPSSPEVAAVAPVREEKKAEDAVEEERTIVRSAPHWRARSLSPPLDEPTSPPLPSLPLHKTLRSQPISTNFSQLTPFKRRQLPRHLSSDFFSAALDSSTLHFHQPITIPPTPKLSSGPSRTLRKTRPPTTATSRLWTGATSLYIHDIPPHVTHAQLLALASSSCPSSPSPSESTQETTKGYLNVILSSYHPRRALLKVGAERFWAGAWALDGMKWPMEWGLPPGEGGDGKEGQGRRVMRVSRLGERPAELVVGAFGKEVVEPLEAEGREESRIEEEEQGKASILTISPCSLPFIVKPPLSSSSDAPPPPPFTSSVAPAPAIAEQPAPVLQKEASLTSPAPVVATTSTITQHVEAPPSPPLPQPSSSPIIRKTSPPSSFPTSLTTTSTTSSSSYQQAHFFSSPSSTSTGATNSAALATSTLAFYPSATTDCSSAMMWQARQVHHLLSGRGGVEERLSPEEEDGHEERMEVGTMMQEEMEDGEW